MKLSEPEHLSIHCWFQKKILRNYGLKSEGYSYSGPPVQDRGPPPYIKNQLPDKAETKINCSPAKSKRYIPWASLLKRVFKHEVETCAFCGGEVKIEAVVNDKKTIEATLSELESLGQIDRTEPTFEQVAQALRGPPDLNI